MIEMENQRGENDRFLNRSDHQLLKIEDVDPKILYVHVPSKRMFVTVAAAAVLICGRICTHGSM